MSGKVLVPYDFSPAAEEALRWAAQYARDTGAELLALHVSQIVPPVIGPSVVFSIPAANDMGAAREGLREAVAGLGVPSSIVTMLATTPGPAIVAEAEKLGATLVVMGTRGHGGLTRLVLGSVADYVVRHAHCPVVTLHGSGGPARAGDEPPHPASGG